MNDSLVDSLVESYMQFRFLIHNLNIAWNVRIVKHVNSVRMMVLNVEKYVNLVMNCQIIVNIWRV